MGILVMYRKMYRYRGNGTKKKGYLLVSHVAWLNCLAIKILNWRFIGLLFELVPVFSVRWPIAIKEVNLFWHIPIDCSHIVSFISVIDFETSC